MKAQYLLRENIKELLRVRREDASALSGWLKHDKSWINKILNGHRDMQIEDFDRVAEFFGIATYQLFQPGISRLTERRLLGERRGGRDRRVGHAHRDMVELRSAVHPDSQKAMVHAAASDDSADPAYALAKDFARRIVAYAASADARRQDPEAGRPVARLRPRPRTDRGSNAARAKPK